MEVRLQPELAAKVKRWSAETGLPIKNLVEDAITVYFSEVEEIKATLDSRYDDIVNGKVKGIPGEEAIRVHREKAAARNRSRAAGAAKRPKTHG